MVTPAAPPCTDSWSAPAPATFLPEVGDRPWHGGVSPSDPCQGLLSQVPAWRSANTWGPALPRTGVSLRHRLANAETHTPRQVWGARQLVTAHPCARSGCFRHAAPAVCAGGWLQKASPLSLVPGFMPRPLPVAQCPPLLKAGDGLGCLCLPPGPTLDGPVAEPRGSAGIVRPSPRKWA